MNGTDTRRIVWITRIENAIVSFENGENGKRNKTKQDKNRQTPLNESTKQFDSMQTLKETFELLKNREFLQIKFTRAVRASTGSVQNI